MTPVATKEDDGTQGADAGDEARRVDRTINIRRLGRADYLPVLEAMRAHAAARTEQQGDEIWLVEHPPVYTLGITGRREHLLRPTDIPVVQTERGGQVTYHGPGQAVVYPLIDLRRRGIKVREFVHIIEEAVLATLAAYNVPGMRKPGAPGIYVADAQGSLDKIAALGLRVRNGCTFHGVSLNVDMDLTPFSWINPCGYADLRTIDLATLGILADVNEAGERLACALIAELNAWPAP